MLIIASFGSYLAYQAMAAPLDSVACQGDFKQITGLGCARDIGNGMYKIQLADGSEAESHGPDYTTQQQAEDVVYDMDIGPGDPLRQPVCSTTYRTVFLYTYQKGSTNNYDANKAHIIEVAKRMNYFLNQESLASSGDIGADYKVRCDTSNEIFVGTVQATGTDLTTVVNNAIAAGYNSTYEKYIMFNDFTTSFCGISYLDQDSSLSSSNVNNYGQGFGMISKNCWDTIAPMHESGHTLGAVMPTAPNSSGNYGHCNDGMDIMCYADGSDKSAYNPNVCTTKIFFDCNYDSYFDTRPESGEWLQTHWNIGVNTSWATFNNNFLKFTTGVVTPTPTPTPPPTTTIPGDANGDNRVNAIDLSILISHDGQNYPAADFNKDGSVGSADMAILLAKWTW